MTGTLDADDPYRLANYSFGLQFYYSRILGDRLAAVVTVFLLAGIGVLAQSAALFGRFEERAAVFSRSTENLQRELRAYANGVGRYETVADPTKAWKQFDSAVEDILSYAADAGSGAVKRAR